MALLVHSVSTAPRARSRDRSGPWVVLAAATAVLARIPFLGLPAGADEAGFLQVGAQWAPGGGSLYGHYWVDRPPLLLALFQLAAWAGGVIPLRLLGCFAAAAVVLLVGWTAHQVGGSRAAGWAAVTAAALTVSPLLDALEVNGELLAAPCVALGIGACLAADRASTSRRTAFWWVLAGAAGVGAVLVKQNIVDVFVFALALLATGVLNRQVRRRTALGAAALGAVGVAIVALAVAVWTTAHGTSPGGVAYAMYPFRLQAAKVVATSGSPYASTRLAGIVIAWLLSGLALLTGCLAAGAVGSRLRDPVLVALTATAAFDVVSVALGGGYWLHYLMQLVVPLSVGIGVMATRTVRPVRRLTRAACGVTVLSAAASLAFTAVHPPHSDGQVVGAAIHAVAARGDTLTTLYGEAQVNLAAGLPSPYPYLWSLPTKTLDPRLVGLDAVLTGPRAPTWLVTSHQIATWGLATAATQSIVETRYHRVAVIDGQSVYVRDGVVRASPRPIAPLTTSTARRPADTQERP